MSRDTLQSIVALSLCVAVCVPSAPVLAQTKRTMTAEDLVTAVRVGDPQLSPDERRVLYVRTTTDLSAGKRNSDIWTVPADGSAPPQPFIESPKGDDTPRFLPNGRVAFISSRDGTPQVYVADADGRNATVLTHLSAGAQGPMVVSPDGKLVAFVSDVSPACADEGCNTRSAGNDQESDYAERHTDRIDSAERNRAQQEEEGDPPPSDGD